MTDETMHGLLLKLSPDHIEVMRCLAHGMSYAETAAALHLSRRTVKRRCYEAMNQIGARSRIEAVALLIDAKVIRLEG